MTYGISRGWLGRRVGVDTARRCPDPGAGGRTPGRRRSLPRTVITHCDALVLGQQAEIRTMPCSQRKRKREGGAGSGERGRAAEEERRRWRDGGRQGHELYSTEDGGKKGEIVVMWLNVVLFAGGLFYINRAWLASSWHPGILAFWHPGALGPWASHPGTILEPIIAFRSVE